MYEFNLFQSNVHWKLIRYLCLKGNRDYLNVSEIASKIDASKAMVSVALKDLHSSGFLKRRDISNSHIYSISEGPLIGQIKRTIGLSMVIESGLTELLIDKDPDLITIALYGSFARGDFDDMSDIDILLITSTRKERFTYLPGSIDSFELNVETFTPGSWSVLNKKNEVFYSRVMEDHIILYGSGLI
jgi:hypothetical protein